MARRDTVLTVVSYSLRQALSAAHTAPAAVADAVAIDAAAQASSWWADLALGGAALEAKVGWCRRNRRLTVSAGA